MEKKPANLQEIFNKVVTHLLTQNARSFNAVDGKCLYRGDKGLKCAVGCLITDEYYHPNLEGRYAGADAVLQAVLDSLEVFWSQKLVDLLIKLQRVHDERSTDSWQAEINAVATEFNLEMPT